MKNRKILIPIMILALAILVGIAVFITVNANSSEKKLAHQLDLGSKYLAEGNYEQAIAAFEVAISIDLKKVDAYIGLANAYVALAEEALNIDDRNAAHENYEKAIVILENAKEVTDDVLIIELQQEIEEKNEELERIAEDTSIENVIEKAEEEEIGELSIVDLFNYATLNGKMFDEYTTDSLIEEFGLIHIPGNIVQYDSDGSGIVDFTRERDVLTVHEDGEVVFERNSAMDSQGTSWAILSMYIRDGSKEIGYLIHTSNDLEKYSEDGLYVYFKEHNIKSLDDFANYFGITRENDEGAYMAMTEYGVCKVSYSDYYIHIENDDIEVRIAQLIIYDDTELFSVFVKKKY